MTEVSRTFKMKLDKLNKVYNEDNLEDPTLLKATFIILEINKKSENNEVITEEEALKMAKTMALKPLTCQYTPTSNYFIPDDHFGGHGVYKEKFRLDGSEYLATKSFAIGVAKEGCWVDTVEKDGEQVKVLKCDFYLWVTRYLNICSLMEEIFESGAELYSSCEYTYKKEDVEVIDGIKYPKNLIFQGHCLLGRREDGSIVEPAFDISKMTSFNEKWTSTVNEFIKINNEKERNDNMLISKEQWLTVVNEMSQGEIKSSLYDALSKVMTADEFYGIWISSWNVYDTYFVYEKPIDNGYKYYKVNYTKTETEVTIDFEGKVEVKFSEMWIPVEDSEKVVNEKEEEITSLNEKITTLENDNTTLNEKIKILENDKTTLNNKIVSLEGEKVSLNEKYEQATNTVTELNEKVSVLQPIVDTYNKEQYEKTLNEKITYYENKFLSLNAKDKFNAKETQDLIVKSLNDIDAKEKLNDMIIELVPQFNEKQDNKYGKIIGENDVIFNDSNDIDIPEKEDITKSDFDSMFTIE